MIRLFGFLLFITSGIFIWLGAQDGIAIWQRTSAAEDVIGELLRYDPAPDGAAAPVARFRGSDGRDHDILLPPVRQPKDAVGTPVHLIHPPGRPDLAESGEPVALWAPAAVPVGGGLIAAVFGLALMTSRRRRPEDMPRLPLLLRVGLFAVAFALISVAWSEYTAVVDSLNARPRSRGVVVAVDQGGAPTIRYRTADGVVVDYVETGLPAGSLAPGERVTLAYDKGNPGFARVERFGPIWAGVAAWAVAAGLALTLALFAASLRRGKAAAVEPAPVAEEPAHAVFAAGPDDPAPGERRDPTFGPGR
ncbi:DUF3592 domain-containing protein [Zavarzinia compransoris]|uniref:DUF3592 domain-containing protein n=1 Tax=Zavarzinia compransoris TaxID=1264899 RepID=A0A317E115_9PROT|nr:DUF3592 domain-containing protein [Zavarzinia compransoris]PWR18845.1 hypothetical protein DKG75_17870 [Zavarzinia compransoris]TDP48836.1 uncharacterized protein DUF3592 [Zavarzinia compransoris]